MTRRVAPQRFGYRKAGKGLHPSRSLRLFSLTSALAFWFIAVLVQSLFISDADATDSGISLQVVPVMVDVPAGNFKMGNRGDGDDLQVGRLSPNAEKRELPVHTVTLDAYKIGKYEITNGQFAAALNWAQEKGYLKDGQGGRYSGGSIYADEGDRQFIINPNVGYTQIMYSGGKFSCKTRDGYSMESHPVTNATWYGSVVFCNWLSEMVGLTPCYDLSTWRLTTPFPNGYRLPTEAEWERAAAWDPERPAAPVDLRHWIYGFMADAVVSPRPGTSMPRSAHRANYTEGVNPLTLTRSPKTSPVGFFNGINIGTVDSRSPVGCYDMSGNVAEWCHDLYKDDYYATGGPPWKNPTGPGIGKVRVVRGGAYNGSFNMTNMRTAGRTGASADRMTEYIGFRVARTPHGVEVEGEQPEQPEAPALLARQPESPVREAAAIHTPGEERTLAGIEFVWVPPGTFMMGSEDGFHSEGPPHRVTISRGLWLGKYELTKGQWKSVMKTEPWKGKSEVIDDQDSPAVYVSPEDARTLIEKLNAGNGGGFRLPTEAEWEYACRAGSDTAFCFGDDPGKVFILWSGSGENLAAYAWYSENTWKKYARTVGQKKPNAWGLHDMHGNVWEFCQDKYWEAYYTYSPDIDPACLQRGYGRVLRGGDFESQTRRCRSAQRGSARLDESGPDKGIRLARYDEPMPAKTVEITRTVDGRRPKPAREWPARPSPQDAREMLSEMGVAPTSENLVKYAGGGQLDTVNLLLGAGVNIDSIAQVGRKTRFRPEVQEKTALLVAIDKDENEMARFLIDRGADVNVADIKGLTPLTAAAGKGDFEMFEFLLAEGADPNIPDRNGRTTLLAAAESGNVEIVNALLAKGPDPNYADATGHTPLLLAIKEGNTEAAMVLLANGADPYIANADGRTSLYYAAVFKADAEIFEALLAAGMDPNARDEGGRTILDIVVMVGSADGVPEILIAHGATRPVRKPLFELWVALFLLIVLPLPYYRFHNLQNRYYRRKEEDGSFYFEIRRRDDTLWRKIQVLPDEPPIREVVSGNVAMEEMSDLIPCGAREFRRYWKRRNMAYLLLNLHARLCVLAVLCSTIGLVISAEEQARRYGRFSPLFSFFEFLEHFFYNADEWLLGALIGAPLVAGGLELIVLFILQFAKPSLRQRVIAIVIGVVAGIISIGCGLFYIAFAMSFS